ncbi:hypothetical protein ACFQU2_15455 [Siccirubricoccus deserti]
MRVALSSSTIAVYSLVVALVFRAGMRRQRLPSHRATIGVLVAHGLVHAIRATGAITLGFDTSGTAAPEASWNAVVAVLAITLLACFAGLLIALAGNEARLPPTPCSLRRAMRRPGPAGRNRASSPG